MDRSVGGNGTEVLTPLVWEKYFARFGNGGMETYENIMVLNPQSLCSDLEKVDPGRVHRVLKMREVNERIQSTFFLLDENNSQDASKYLHGIETYLAPLSLKCSVSGSQRVSIPTEFSLPASLSICSFGSVDGKATNIENAENDNSAERYSNTEQSRNAERYSDAEQSKDVKSYGDTMQSKNAERYHDAEQLRNAERYSSTGQSRNIERYSDAEQSRDAERLRDAERCSNTEQYRNAKIDNSAENLSYERKFHLRIHRTTCMLTLIEMDITEPIPAEVAKKNRPWEQ